MTSNFLGGRQGQRDEESGYDESNVGHSREKFAGNTASKLIAEQLEHRRKQYNAAEKLENMPTNRIVRIKQATSTTTKIKHMTIHIRNTTVLAIAKKLKENVELCAQANIHPPHKLKQIDYEEIAAELEYQECFTKHTSAIMYRNSFVKLQKQIKTHDVELHPAILQYVPPERNDHGGSANDLKRKMDELDPTQQSASTSMGGFQTARELHVKRHLQEPKRIKKDTMKQSSISSFYTPKVKDEPKNSEAPAPVKVEPMDQDSDSAETDSDEVANNHPCSKSGYESFQRAANEADNEPGPFQPEPDDDSQATVIVDMNVKPEPIDNEHVEQPVEPDTHRYFGSIFSDANAMTKVKEEPRDETTSVSASVKEEPQEELSDTDTVLDFNIGKNAKEEPNLSPTCQEYPNITDVSESESESAGGYNDNRTSGANSEDEHDMLNEMLPDGLNRDESDMTYFGNIMDNHLDGHLSTHTVNDEFQSQNLCSEYNHNEEYGESVRASVQRSDMDHDLAQPSTSSGITHDRHSFDSSQSQDRTPDQHNVGEDIAIERRIEEDMRRNRKVLTPPLVFPIPSSERPPTPPPSTSSAQLAEESVPHENAGFFCDDDNTDGAYEDMVEDDICKLFVERAQREEEEQLKRIPELINAYRELMSRNDKHSEQRRREINEELNELKVQQQKRLQQKVARAKQEKEQAAMEESNRFIKNLFFGLTFNELQGSKAFRPHSLRGASSYKKPSTSSHRDNASPDTNTYNEFMGKTEKVYEDEQEMNNTILSNAQKLISQGKTEEVPAEYIERIKLEKAFIRQKIDPMLRAHLDAQRITPEQFTIIAQQITRNAWGKPNGNSIIFHSEEVHKLCILVCFLDFPDDERLQNLIDRAVEKIPKIAMNLGDIQ